MSDNYIERIAELTSERDHYRRALAVMVEFRREVLATNAPQDYKRGVVEATRIASEVIMEHLEDKP